MANYRVYLIGCDGHRIKAVDLMTLMNFDYWGAVNFLAIIIGH